MALIFSLALPNFNNLIQIRLSLEIFPPLMHTYIIFGLQSLLRSQAFTLKDLW
jgi:hypothetical protein